MTSKANVSPASRRESCRPLTRKRMDGNLEQEPYLAGRHYLTTVYGQNGVRLERFLATTTHFWRLRAPASPFTYSERPVSSRGLRPADRARSA